MNQNERYEEAKKKYAQCGDGGGLPDQQQQYRRLLRERECERHEKHSFRDILIKKMDIGI